MLRSKSQILWGYLPGSVFRHEDRVYGRVVTVDGVKMTGLNEAVIYDALDELLDALPRARRRSPKDLAEVVRRNVRNTVDQAWGKKPLCVVHVIGV